MGLLDSVVGNSIDDPRTAATAAMVQGLLGGQGFAGGMSAGLLGYQDQMAKAKRRQQEEQLQKFHLDQLQRTIAQQAAQDKFRSSIPSPMMQASQSALQGGGGPTQANAAQIQPVSPDAQMMHGALQAGLIDPVQYIQSQRKDNTPMKVGAGEALVDPRTFKPIFTNPKEDSTPAAIKEYNFAKGQGYPGTFQQFQLEQRKAGATTVSVPINTAKPLLSTIAEGLGKQIDSSLETAKGAVNSIQTAQSLKSAIDSGKVIAGPGASFRVAGLQLGQMLGIGGKDAAETLSNTRTAIQSMAQSELNAAAQMKGQGQITEAERALLKKAASGDIDSLTAPEIRQLADVSERSARNKINQHTSNVSRLKSMPDAGPLVQFYGVEQPPAYVAPAAAGGVRRYNPATGQLE